MYIVMESSANMPSSCKAAYRRIAVVEIDQEYTAYNLRPKMISDRARGVLRITATWIEPAAGKTERSGVVRARRAANEMAYRLNNARDQATVEDIIGAGGSA